MKRIRRMETRFINNKYIYILYQIVHANIVINDYPLNLELLTNVFIIMYTHTHTHIFNTYIMITMNSHFYVYCIRGKISSASCNS